MWYDGILVFLEDYGGTLLILLVILLVAFRNKIKGWFTRKKKKMPEAPVPRVTIPDTMFSASETMNEQKQMIESEIAFLNDRGNELKEQYAKLEDDYNKEVNKLNQEFGEQRELLKTEIHNVKKKYNAKIQQARLLKQELILQENFDKIDKENQAA